VRVVVLSDTHVPQFARALPPVLTPELERADAIVHAGDVNEAFVLDELAAFAPVHVAMGNNDRADVLAWGALEEVRLDLNDVAIGVVHDSGPRTGRERRLRRRFPDERVIVFGHSHIPMAYEDEAVLFLNPGSPTWKRRQPRPTFAVLEIVRRRPRARIVEL
jgi:putative phosphoesterase